MRHDTTFSFVRSWLSELSGRVLGGLWVAEAYIGVYWTLPVNWAGFRDLPPSVERAAAASKTIRYQRERVRCHVREDAGRLVGEIAFMDTRTDRATEAVADVLRREMPAYTGMKVALLTVTFHEVHHWRPNPFMHRIAGELGLSLIGLPPDPLTIDGQVFDPARHFAAWRKQDASVMTRLRLEAQEALQAALLEVPTGDRRWQIVAELLNDRAVRTIRGGRWTPENVRKLAGRLHLDR